MNIDQFLELSDNEKEKAVWDKGNFFKNYTEGVDICDVYELFNFYVAFCYKLHENEKAEITAHANADECPYLIQV